MAETQSIRILLVEDNPGDALLLKETLSQVLGAAFSIACASNLSDGIKLLHEQVFDAVLLDLSLPDSGGIATLLQVNADAVASGLPVIVLTGLDRQDIGIEAVRKGAQDYLVKGKVSPELLERSIHYAIERKATHRALQLANDNLEQKVIERTAQLRLIEREVLDATEREQQRIGRDLHDSIQGGLIGMGMMLGALKNSLAGGSGVPPKIADGMDNLANIVKDTLHQTRGLVRGLCPLELKNGGLMNAVRQLAATTSDLFRVKCEFRCDSPVSVGDETAATQLYRICQEAVNNALKHAKAKCIAISLCRGPSGLTLEIQDDGLGLPADADTRGGLGLRTMNYRAKMIGADLSVGKGKTRGTLVRCSLAADKK